MLTLALDCSTARGSVAIGRTAEGGGKMPVVWERLFPAGRGHGGELFSTLEEGLRAAGSGPLEKIIVGLGPGSYSGVRQAIAVATGLSLSVGATLVGVPSTAALETGLSAYHVIGDARRGTFYYTAVEGGRLLDGPTLLENAEALQARLDRHPDWPVLAVESVPAGLQAEVALPSAARLLAVSSALHQAGPLEPIYLRPPAVTLPKAKVPR